MLRLLADENFNGEIVRGLLLRQPEMDLVRVQDVNLSSADDSAVLAWAAENDRIILTHDRATMPYHAHERLSAGKRVAGVFIFSDRFPVGHAIDEILLIASCTEQGEWNGVVRTCRCDLDWPRKVQKGTKSLSHGRARKKPSAAEPEPN